MSAYATKALIPMRLPKPIAESEPAAQPFRDDKARKLLHYPATKAFLQALHWLGMIICASQTMPGPLDMKVAGTNPIERAEILRNDSADKRT